MADATVWSRLPEVFLPLIIEHTSDPTTLINWTLCTRKASYRHRIALRRAYHTLVIGHEDILNAPYYNSETDGDNSDSDDSDISSSDEEDSAIVSEHEINRVHPVLAASSTGNESLL